jgi:hypothetical protein
MGGPLLVVPITALSRWGGCTMTGIPVGGTETPDDYDRACAVQGLAGAIAMGVEGIQALVLADEPVKSCYLPEHRTFLRWLAANSEAELATEASRVLADPATAWVDCGTWTTDGPAVLMDSANAGSELGVEYPSGGFPDQAPVPITAGTWRIRAFDIAANPDAWVGLVQLLPSNQQGPS